MVEKLKKWNTIYMKDSQYLVLESLYKQRDTSYKPIYQLKIIYVNIHKPPIISFPANTIVSPLHLKQLSPFYRVTHINTIHQISLKFITTTVSNSTLLFLHKNESIGATIRSINYALQYSRLTNFFFMCNT